MFLLDLLILIALGAGHTELVVTLVNRVHSLRIPRPTLRRLRRLEDAVMVAFPPVLLWFVGLNGPSVLRGGRWSELSGAWTAYLALCGVGFIGLVGSVVRHWSHRPPAVQCSNHSHVVDVTKKLGRKPLRKRRFPRLASLPGNESFRVQVSDKRYCLPRVPAEWHELSILHLSDTHFVGTVERAFFEEIGRLSAEMRPDLIVFTGDLLDHLDYLRWLPETFGQLRAPLGCYYVLGNHDWFTGPDEVRAVFDRCGWQGVAGKICAVEHRGHRLEIGGTERPWMGEFPPFGDTADALGAFRLLLSHTPDNLQWARAHRVDLMLAGHNHGGQIVLPGIGPVFAPSRHGVRYASGAFWDDPTLLYVSRGLSARQPLRFNCLPELTRIVLASPDLPSTMTRASGEARPWAGG